MKRVRSLFNHIKNGISRSRKNLFDPRGAVTVFLTIILIPVITVTCVFVDVSRVQLSKAEAHSAADLSLFTLMSHYDEDLKEFYGIVASCQSKEDFIAKSTDYFKGMINAVDSTGAGSTLFTAYANRLLTGDSISFLNAQATEVNIAPLDNSGFGENPALIEDAIVEFMKYRGPVEIAGRLADRFSHMDFDQIDKANRYEPVSKAKEEFAEAESELLEDAFKIYIVLKEYSDYQQGEGVPSFEMYETYATECKDLWTDFNRVTELITKRYAATDGIKVIEFPSISKEEYCKAGYKLTKKEIGHLDSGSGKYYLTSQTYNAIKNEIDNYLDSYIDQINTHANNIVNSVNGLTFEGSGMNETLYVRLMQELVSGDDIYRINQYGEKMLRLYARIKAALECEEDPDDPLPENWDGPDSPLKKAQDRIHNAHKTYFTTEVTTDYTKIRRNYAKANPADVVSKVINKSYEFKSEYLKRPVTIKSFAEEVHQKYKSQLSKVDIQLKRLDYVLNGGWGYESHGKKYNIKKLSKLADEAEDMANKLNTWYDRAHSGSVSDITPVTEKNGDREESERIKKGYTNGKNQESYTDYVSNKSEVMASQIDAESVTKLEKRLKNIRKDLKAYKDALTNLTYGGKSVRDLTNENVYIRAAKTVLPNKIKGEMSLYFKQNEEMARNAASQLIKPGQNDIYSAPARDMSETGNDPVIALNDGHNCPALYKYLDDQFHDKLDETDANVDDARSDQDKWQKEADNAKAGTSSLDYAVPRGDNISGGSGGSGFTEFTGINSLINIISNLVTGHITEIRDEIYVCEYIMDMFTYSDTINEGKYRLKNQKVSQYPYPEADAEWNEISTFNNYKNQSLTNIPLDLDHNHAFLGEVEYILYRNGSIEENLKAAYTDIFELRLALNTVSGFTNFWSISKNLTASTIGHIAHAVAIATQGIIPEVLTKSLLIGVLAVLESAKDLEYLKKGASVTLYKADHKKWFYSLDPVKGNEKKVDKFDGKPGSTAPEDEDGVYYSEYLYMFILLGLTSGGGLKQDMLKRTADLIQANMRKQTGNSEWNKNEAKMYFRLKSKVKVTPLMLTLPHIESFGGSSLQQFRESDTWTTYDIELVRGYS